MHTHDHPDAQWVLAYAELALERPKLSDVVDETAGAAMRALESVGFRPGAHTAARAILCDHIIQAVVLAAVTIEEGSDE